MAEDVSPVSWQDDIQWKGARIEAIKMYPYQYRQRSWIRELSSWAVFTGNSLRCLQESNFSVLGWQKRQEADSDNADLNFLEQLFMALPNNGTWNEGVEVALIFPWWRSHDLYGCHWRCRPFGPHAEGPKQHPINCQSGKAQRKERKEAMREKQETG